MKAAEKEATMTDVLGEAWREIQARHADVPNVVVKLVAGSASGPRSAEEIRWEAGAWRANGALPADLVVEWARVGRGPQEVLAALLHQAAHARAASRGEQDTSRNRRYHNQVFRATAEEFGLVAEELGSRGWAATALADGTAERYAQVLDQLAPVLKGRRRAAGAEGAAKSRGGSRLVLVCECEPANRVWTARATYERTTVMCSQCCGAFRLISEAAEEE